MSVCAGTLTKPGAVPFKVGHCNGARRTLYIPDTTIADYSTLGQTTLMRTFWFATLPQHPTVHCHRGRFWPCVSPRTRRIFCHICNSLSPAGSNTDTAPAPTGTTNPTIAVSNVRLNWNTSRDARNPLPSPTCSGTRGTLRIADTWPTRWPS